MTLPENRLQTTYLRLHVSTLNISKSKKRYFYLIVFPIWHNFRLNDMENIYSKLFRFRSSGFQSKGGDYFRSKTSILQVWIDVRLTQSGQLDARSIFCQLASWMTVSFLVELESALQNQFKIFSLDMLILFWNFWIYICHHWKIHNNKRALPNCASQWYSRHETLKYITGVF